MEWISIKAFIPDWIVKRLIATMILQVNQEDIQTLKLVTKHKKVAKIQEHDVIVVKCMGSKKKKKKRQK